MRITTIIVAAIAAEVCASGCAAPQSELPKTVKADFPYEYELPFRHYVVPAMSEIQRLPDAYPSDGVAGGVVGIVAARDEYEPGSFLLWGDRELRKVPLALTAFKNEKGDVFPAEDLDLKVVKVWYQNKNGWFSYFGDTGFKLLPELLLNDEDLIRVDEKKEANYARRVAKDGRQDEIWINPPRQFGARPLREGWRVGERFLSMREDFHDAATLQPVTIPRERFKQFFLTAHVRKDAKPGLYRGAVKVGDYGEVPVAIRVLDFALPQPKAFADPKKDFLVSSYNYINLGLIAENNGDDRVLARRQLAAILKDQVAHNQTMHWIGGSLENEEGDITVRAMREAGMRLDVLHGLARPGWYDGSKRAERRAHAQRVADEVVRRYGHLNLFMAYGDEPGAGWCEQVRPVFEDYQRAGLRFCLAGGNAVFHKVGYLYDWHNVAKDPSDPSSTRLWNGLQNGNRVAWYANHHVGTENPAFNRRQNGLMPYLMGYTALCNYAHHLGPYNDDSEGYKPMVFAYGTYDGVIDTLQWEGFREGVDDIRYATLMTDLARKAQKSKDLETRYLGGQALEMLALLDVKSYDQDMARAEMIRYIEALRTRVPGYEAQPEWTKSSDAERAAATKRIEDGLAAALAEAKKGFATARNPGQTNEVHKKIVETYKKFFRPTEAFDYILKNGLSRDLLWTGKNVMTEDAEKGYAFYKAILSAEHGSGALYHAFWPMLCDYPGRQDETLAFFENAFFGAIRREDTNTLKRVVTDVFNALSGGKGEGGRHQMALAGQHYKAFAKVYEKTLPYADRAGVVLPCPAAVNAYEAYLAQNNVNAAKKVVQRALKNPELKPEEKYALGLAEALAGCWNSGEDATLSAVRAFDAKNGKGVPAKERLNAVCRLAGAYLTAGRERVVRGLVPFRKGLYVPAPKKRYVVKFSDRPVMGVWDWDKVAAETAVYDRTYGGKLDILETDVSSGNRGAVGSSKDVVANPSMKVVADARGLHFFYVAPEPKAKEIAMGTVSGGSYEGYIAPGANEPYVCVMVTPGDDAVTFFDTTYNTFGQRRIEADSNGVTYRTETAFLDDKIVTYVFFSWRAWPTKAPANGTVWDYENISWNRSGSFCWNGTESIHGRSTWGELEFKMTDAQRRAMLTPMLCRAWADFKAERLCTGRHDGCFAKWKDPVLGDPEFYEKELKELEAKLVKYGELLTPDMSDSTFAFLVREALPQWTDVVFEVQRRRARWMEAKLTK